jgi:uncharacterized integral membrane protein
MFRKIVTVIIVLPLAAIIIAFAVANRQMVTVSFDPFSTTDPAYAATVPLFILIFALVILGVIVGGVASWLRQGAWRRTARKLDHDVRRLHQELAALRDRHLADVKPADVKAAVARDPATESASKSPTLPVIPPPAA